MSGFLAALGLAASAMPAAAAPRHVAPAPCTLEAADKAWLDGAVSAWSFTTRNITHIRLPPVFKARVFDAHCLLTSDAALAGGADRWSGSLHHGRIPLPDGKVLKPSVISFASGDRKRGYFVMSTPSVWAAGGVDGGSLGLERLMVAVLLHEASHVAQMPTYGRRMELLSKRNALPESFSDDSIQERFGDAPAFAASIDRETKLLLAAAEASNAGDARRLGGEALAAVRARQARWFTGKDAYLAPAEDIWLTMEGSAQWAGYRWLIDLGGAGLSRATALSGFCLRGKWWTQKEGCALFLALDRLTLGKWKQHAFGDGALTGLAMLDLAVNARRPVTKP